MPCLSSYRLSNNRTTTPACLTKWRDSRPGNGPRCRSIRRRSTDRSGGCRSVTAQHLETLSLFGSFVACPRRDGLGTGGEVVLGDVVAGAHPHIRCRSDCSQHTSQVLESIWLPDNEGVQRKGHDTAGGARV